MGGCAGKPKNSDILQGPLPAEGSASHNKAAVAEGETVAQDSNNGGEIQTRMTFTLIGNCGSKGFCDSVLPTTVVHAPLVCAEAGEAPAKKTEDKVETPPVSESKDKVEAGNETQEPAKEGQDEAKADKPDAAPSLEDKVDQPDAAPSSEDKSGALHATA
ncbi:uncharacterized protein LOC133856266 isoform X2 [Alnus glutinosa]|uniref:uncharacterized protein LOC133856266 isoform X2 n=1 Tax=Alnus glutinosa TaxID=3517 RepID=UPI002D776092|nr:uncharacterized protein LOC133856266 isoform X2 [Alnus glutinosa]